MPDENTRSTPTPATRGPYERTAALYAGKLGVTAIPLNGKRPAIADWTNATSSPEQIAKWIAEFPDANVGILAGRPLPDGRVLVILDVDPRNGGLETLTALERQHGPLPVGPEVISGRGDGGGHRYLAVPPGTTLPATLGPGLDLLGRGRQAVAPPSIHPDSGQAYRWAAGRKLGALPIPDAPAWVASSANATAAPGQTDWARTLTEPIAEGARDDTLTRIAGYLALHLPPEAVPPVLGSLNSTLVNPPLPDEDIARIATSIGKAEGRKHAGEAPSFADLAVRPDPTRILEAPPARAYLLTTDEGVGVVVRGRVCLLAGKGGIGKTYLEIQLAVSQALGRDFLGWRTGKPGRVLLALGEEDLGEFLRRVHFVCAAYGLNANEIALVARGLLIIPLAGIGSALTHEAESASGKLPETERAEQLRDILRGALAAGEPFDLVIIDPMSRFAGADVEKDNAAATRFMQVVETFAAPECGAPTVLVAHHLRKAGKDDDGEASELIRGAVALLDACRSAFILAPMKPLDGAPALVRLRMVKSNYTAIPEPLVLSRGAYGTLQLATHAERNAYSEAQPVKGRPKGLQAEDLGPEILTAIAEKPDSAAGVAARIHKRDETVGRALKMLEAGRQAVRVAGKWHLFPNSSRRTSGSATATSSQKPPPVRGGKGEERRTLPAPPDVTDAEWEDA